MKRIIRYGCFFLSVLFVIFGVLAAFRIDFMQKVTVWIAFISLAASFIDYIATLLSMIPPEKDAFFNKKVKNADHYNNKQKKKATIELHAYLEIDEATQVKNHAELRRKEKRLRKQREKILNAQRDKKGNPRPFYNMKKRRSHLKRLSYLFVLIIIVVFVYYRCGGAVSTDSFGYLSLGLFFISHWLKDHNDEEIAQMMFNAQTKPAQRIEATIHPENK